MHVQQLRLGHGARGVGCGTEHDGELGGAQLGFEEGRVGEEVAECGGMGGSVLA